MVGGITLSKIVKNYQKEKVFDNFSYSFNDTGLYVLFGYSGCGKTTLLNIICGLTDFQKGSITFNNERFLGQVSNEKVNSSIAYIAQDVYFVDYLTVFDNLVLCSNACDEDSIQSLLKKFKLEDKKNMYPMKLSGGEKQRLAIVQAILMNKKVLLLDEPTSSLDYENKTIIFQLLKELKNELLIICSTHDQAIFNYSDNIIDLSNLNRTYTNNKEKNIIKIGDVETNKPSQLSNFKAVQKLVSYMNKKRKYKYREKKSNIMLFIVFCISLLVCFSVYDYKEKLLQSLNNQYKVNYLTVYCPLSTGDYCNSIFEEKEVKRVSYIYDLNSPQPSYIDREEKPGDSVVGEDIDFETEIKTLPFDSKFFPYGDSIVEGRYFSSKNQIILGNKKAKSLSTNIENLIGKKYTIILPDGKEEFEIIGIFNNFDFQTETYLKSNLGNVDLNNMIFINDKYLEKYLTDDTLGMSERSLKSTAFYVYFDQYEHLNRFYKQYISNRYGNEIVVEDYTKMFIDYVHTNQTMQKVTYPIVIFSILLSVLFYFQTKKIELNYTKYNLCVYQYYGYSYRQVRSATMLHFALEIISKYVLAAIITILMTQIFNYLNNIFYITDYQLFLIDFRVIFVTFVSLGILSLLTSFALFEKIKMDGWYNMLKERRDLL